MTEQKTRRRVLVTGAAGAIGRAVCEELLRAGYGVRGFDRVPMDQLDDAIVGHLEDFETVRQAVAGTQTVIHLAATPDDADFLTELLPNNILGLYHVFEAARREPVERLIVASTGQVVWGLLGEEPETTIRIEDGVAPRNHYAATKVFAEAMGEVYAHRFGLSVIVVRPGWLPREPHHVAAMARSRIGQAMYLSPGDAGRFFRCAVEAEGIPFAVLFATSRSNGPVLFDLEPARRLIGFEPQDTYPDGMPHPLPTD